MEPRHGVGYTADMRQIIRIDSTLCKTLVRHAKGFESDLRAWELDVGEWERASGTALADAVKYTMMMNMAPKFLGEQSAVGYIRQQCCSSNSFVAMELFIPKLWSESDRGSWKWNKRR